MARAFFSFPAAHLFPSFCLSLSLVSLSSFLPSFYFFLPFIFEPYPPLSFPSFFDRSRCPFSSRSGGNPATKEKDGNLKDTMDVQHDCDSDELEMLEDEAEEEQTEDSEIDLLVERAAILYPPAKVDAMVNELKQQGLVHFMRSYVTGLSKDQVKALIIALGTLLPRKLRDDSDLPLPIYVTILKTALARILRRREKLPQYNTVDDAVELLNRSRNIVVLGGAGISTSCGIPDFRSKDGIYAQLQKEGRYDLADPQDMFDKEYFLQDPSCFFSFAHSIFPSNFVPSPSHRFIKLLEEKKKLLRNYTQNIDTLEEAAGVSHYAWHRCTASSP